ncbi:DUF6303 family protein [Streptomyces sp. S584]|uniref:DUF6303 family protein n=1 Tax=Streptomyces sp. S584 TaxID=3096010 RepID=UPI002AFF3066|nr:DUF6303 family protein [Streptomyces sp. S584]
MAGYKGVLCFSYRHDPAGCWSVHVINENGLPTSDMAYKWVSGSPPPPLLDRYDALASLGYAVVDGGIGSWGWHELPPDRGRTKLVAMADVRRLRPDEVISAKP